MNDVEDRLRLALREAAWDGAVPEHLVRAAAAGATRVRRRRLATRGLVGAAAVVTGGAVAAYQRPAPDRQLAPVAPATASATSAAQVVRVVVRRAECGVQPSCVRVEYHVSVPGRTPDTETVLTRDDRSNGWDPRPTRVTVEYADGTVDTVVPVESGEGEWTAELAVPAGVVVHEVVVHDQLGTQRFTKAREPR